MAKLLTFDGQVINSTAYIDIYIYVNIYRARSKEIKRAGTNWGKGTREEGRDKERDRDRQREREREREGEGERLSEKERERERERERESFFALRGRGGHLLRRVLGGVRERSPLQSHPPPPPGTSPNGRPPRPLKAKLKNPTGQKLT